VRTGAAPRRQASASPSGKVPRREGCPQLAPSRGPPRSDRRAACLRLNVADLRRVSARNPRVMTLKACGATRRCASLPTRRNASRASPSGPWARRTIPRTRCSCNSAAGSFPGAARARLRSSQYSASRTVLEPFDAGEFALAGPTIGSNAQPCACAIAIARELARVQSPRVEKARHDREMGQAGRPRRTELQCAAPAQAPAPDAARLPRFATTKSAMPRFINTNASASLRSATSPGAPSQPTDAMSQAQRAPIRTSPRLGD